MQVSAGEPGFDEEVLDKIRGVPEVSAAAPVIEASVTAGGTSLLILGVDMLGDRNLRTYDLEDSDDGIDDPLVFLAQPDSLMISKTLADQKGLTIDSKIPMRTMTGRAVVHRPRHHEAGRTGQRLRRRPGGDGHLRGGENVRARKEVRSRGHCAAGRRVAGRSASGNCKALLGPGFQVEPPSSRGEQFEATSRVYALASDITSLFALFIGMFIIYNTFAIAVTQRRAEIGILRALGATRGQIRTLFMAESALTGLAGTALGVLAGLVLARAMAGYIGGFLESIYGVAQAAGAITPGPENDGGRDGDGIANQSGGGGDSGANAARVDPVKALQKGQYQS